MPIYIYKDKIGGTYVRVSISLRSAMVIVNSSGAEIINLLGDTFTQLREYHLYTCGEEEKNEKSREFGFFIFDR